jgi:hypothetical protein
MTTLINLAIGMMAIFLFVSLFVSVIQELIAQAFALRARYLRLGVIKLLETGKTDLGVLGSLRYKSPRVDAFFDSPLIQALSSVSRPGRPAVPSYMSKETFVSLVMQVEQLAARSPAQLLDRAAILKAKNDPTPLDHAIAAFAEEAGGNLKRLQSRLGEWFDESMERIGGAYKRWTQISTIIIGIFFAGVFNVDCIAISRTLLGAPEQAAAFADAVAGLTQGQQADDELRKQLTAAITQAKLPIGWSASDDLWTRLKLSWLGWLCTGLAASLGSAFWFDTLKRFVSIRSSGIKPADKGTAAT